jgi:hypothetical protein
MGGWYTGSPVERRSATRRVCRHPDFEAEALALLGLQFARSER